MKVSSQWPVSGWEVQAFAFYFANFAVSRASTGAGTKVETSPPMPAICRTSVAVMGRTMGEAGRKNGLDAGSHGTIHARHLHLIIKVCPVTQAADQQRCTDVAGGLNDETAECDGFKPGFFGMGDGAADIHQHCHALIRREDGGLAGVDANREHQPVCHTAGGAHHIKVPVGWRIKGATINGGAQCGFAHVQKG